MKANHEKEWVPFKTGKGDIEVEVDRGQFIFGRKSAAKELKMNQSSVRNRMVKLKNIGNLDIQSAKQYSLVTICNYNKYQNDENKVGQAKGQAKDRQRTPKGHPKDTNKNPKNYKKYNTPPTPPRGGNGYDPIFLKFWEIYPRKEGKAKAAQSWKKIRKPAATLDQIKTALEWQIKSEQWTKDNGQFIPNPTTYLNQRRWEDENNQSKLEAAKIAEEKKAFEKQIEQQMKRREEFLKNNPDYYEEKKYGKKRV